MIELKLFFITPEGCEWLDQHYTAHSLVQAKHITLEWYKLNRPTAARLVDGWIRNGETEETAVLWPAVTCEIREIEKELSKYIDQIEQTEETQ